MRCLITRTSSYLKKPCDEAVEEEYTIRETDNGLAKDIVFTGWVVRFHDGDELLDFILKYDEVIVSKTEAIDITCALEIYDANRE